APPATIKWIGFPFDETLGFESVCDPGGARSITTERSGELAHGERVLQHPKSDGLRAGETDVHLTHPAVEIGIPATGELIHEPGDLLGDLVEASVWHLSDLIHVKYFTS